MSQPLGSVNQYLYEKIYDELKEEILSGTYKKGDWFPPERLLKERFNTTHLTVRNALAKLVLEGYIERYSGKGTIVIYAPNQSAVARQRLRLRQACIIVSRIDEANARLLDALEERLRRLSLPVRYSCHHGDALLERSLYAQAKESDSVVILEPTDGDSSLVRSGAELPNTVLVNAAAEGFRGPQVFPDYVRGARDAVRFLHDLGYREIAHLCSGLSWAAVGIRQGYETGLADRGIAADPALVASGVPGVAGGDAACRKILERQPQCRAFFCASDEAAAGAGRALLEWGLTPGRTCSVVGYGNTRLAEAMDMTTVDTGIETLCEQIYATVMEAVAGGRFPEGSLAVAPELKVRASCCPAVTG